MAAGPPITDPEAIRLLNEQIRPLCEAARALKVRVLAMDAAWKAGINQKYPGDDSPVDDRRDAEGVSRLTGYKVGVAHDNLLAAVQVLDDLLIGPPCVRRLEVS